MVKSVFAALLLVVAGSVVANAEGLPSKSKLGQLGLSSMDVVNDKAGDEVRGAGFGATYLTYTLSVFIDAGNNAIATGTQSSTFGQEAQALGTVAFGGSGFGGFTNSAAPDFSTFVSTPKTVSASVGGLVAVSSIQGFSWGIGR